MVKNQQIQTNKNTKKTIATNPASASALDRFALSFEYDKTLQQIKQDVRIRTI